MSQVCISLLPLFVLFSIRLVYGFRGDNVMLMPQYEVRSPDPYLTYSSQTYPAQYQVKRHIQPQVLQSNVMHKRPPPVPATEKQGNPNVTFGDFMQALNEVSQHRGEDFQLPRTGSVGRDDSPAYSTLPRPIGYSRPNYAPPSTYHETPAALPPLEPPSSAQPKVPLLKPDLSGLLAPVTTKVSGKLSGLLGLIFSLLSGSSSGQGSGLKDILIEGIIRPLLVAKGGIKALISKLSIPVISLLLINLEVLITVWWLWEECPEKLEPPPSYSKPTYNYNNSYR